MNFTLRQLQYFIAVGEAGSFRQAAQELDVSQPALSAAVSQLENTFNLDLFIRHHAQGVSLTTTGQTFLSQAKTLISHAAELNHWASDATEKVAGRLVVDVFNPLAAFVVPSVCQSFADAHTDVALTTREHMQADLIERVRLGLCDVAITYNLGLPKDLHFEQLKSLPPYVVLAKNHELAGKKRLSLDELAKWPLVLLDLPLSTEYFLSLFDAKGLTPNVLIKTSQTDVMRSMVGQGRGYALANVRPSNQRSLDNKPLLYVPLSGKSSALSLGFLSVQSARSSQVLTAFMQSARSKLTATKLPGMAE